MSVLARLLGEALQELAIALNDRDAWREKAERLAAELKQIGVHPGHFGPSNCSEWCPHCRARQALEKEG
jgi:hypothetical protein